jgi:tRNA pseudouridine38-40 synthase
MSSDTVENSTTYRLLLEYDGTDFCGWQVQDDLRTVQGCLEDALKSLFGNKTTLIGAGRTDAGVHAKGMVAHFRVDDPREPEVVFRALNATIPPDVRVLDVCIEHPGFHARFDAKWRAYQYRIYSAPKAIGRKYGWFLPDKPDIEILQRLSSELIGNHCFRSFAHNRPDEPHYRSIIYRSEWENDHEGLVYRIEGIRFLHGMVRLLVGTMLDIARGSMKVTSMREVITREDVRFAGTKAPAQGLTLTAVGYHDWPQL